MAERGHHRDAALGPEAHVDLAYARPQSAKKC
jgi:hypothetical protein